MSGVVVSSSEDYSLPDKLLHYAAFSTPFIHSVMSDMESSLFARKIADVKAGNEVFITALPRAGTTLTLECLYSTGEFASYTYRHMPFVRAPLMWQRWSGRFQEDQQTKERAHGDGMLVSVESPEAFEEVIWLHMMKKKYLRPDRILCLHGKRPGAQTRDDLQLSVKKLLATETHAGDTRRYLSKNNSNISRLSYLRGAFPDAKIVIVIREPLAHATSMLKLHLAFLDRHSDDTFSERYMKWLGHFDFGANFRPIDFDSWLDHRVTESYTDINFWLEYWSAAYQHVINASNVNFTVLNFDQLLQQPEIELEKLATELKLKAPEKLLECSARLRAPTSKISNEQQCDPQILQQARAIYQSFQGTV